MLFIHLLTITVEENVTQPSQVGYELVTVTSGIVRPVSKDSDRWELYFRVSHTQTNWCFIRKRVVIKRQAEDDSTGENDMKRKRFDEDISEETVAQILAVINDPKKMLGPEVR